MNKNKSDMNSRQSIEDRMKIDVSSESNKCQNCPKLNKLVDDLYKFMNNLISFMHEQGFKFENMDYFNDLNQKKLGDYLILFKLFLLTVQNKNK